MSDSEVLAEVLTGLADAGGVVRYLQGGGRESVVSYRDLLARATGLLGRFQQQGLRAGDPVILFVRNNAAFIDAFWACQLGGLVPVPLAAGINSEYLHKLATVAAKFDAPFLFSQRDLLQRLRQSRGGNSLFADRYCLLEEIEHLDRAGELHASGPQDTALIQFSSGSTSEPKGVILSHANLLANIGAITAAAAINRDDSTLSWMPLSHDMGLIGFHLVPLFNGLNQTQMDTDLFVRRPARWLEAAHQYRASLLCSPNFGYQHYMKSVARPPDNLDLGKVRLIFNGAEPVSASVCREFVRQLEPAGLDAGVMYPVYGLAEASLAVTFPQPGSGIRSLRLPADSLSTGDAVVSEVHSERSLELVSVGYPVNDCELRICDESGSTLPDYSVGHVQIRGANVSRGYYRCPGCDAAAFVDGWLDTGDLGLMSEQGLIITGRAKDILFVSGQNWYPQDIEQLLVETTGIEAGKVLVAAQRSDANAEDLLLVFVQYRREPDSFVEQLRRVRIALTEHAGLHAHAVIPVHSLPRTSSGKLQRYRLVQAFADGEYDELLATLRSLVARSDNRPAGSDVERQLLDVCQQVFPDREIRPDQNLFELGADSLLLVNIHEEIEARFPGKVEITDLFDYPTISTLAEYIES